MTSTIGRTMTTGAETETVPRESPTLLPTPPEGAPPHWPASTPWPTPGRRPAAGISNAGAPAAIGRGRQRPFPGAPDGDGGEDDSHRAHAPSSDPLAHRLGRHADSTTRSLVKATMKRLASEYGKPRKQAKGLRLILGFEGARRITARGCGPDKASESLLLGQQEAEVPQANQLPPANAVLYRTTDGQD